MKKLIVLIYITTLCVNTAYSRWANYEDAPTEVEFLYDHTVINEDGTNESVIELQETILNESGREYAVNNCRVNYNSNTSIFTILEAKTISPQGVEYPVTDAMIEDKPLASLGYGFDEQRQLFISYPNVEIGSKIYIKYKIEEKKVSMPGHFADYIQFGTSGYLTKHTMTIISKIPLDMQINDPHNVLHVTTDRAKKFHSITVTLKKPISTDTINEPSNGVVNPKYKTWILISSFDTWRELAAQFSSEYNNVINQPMPKFFVNILELAKAKNSDLEIINTVTSKLNEKMQYIGDWRSVHGKLFPRNLKQIASTQVGDCKDFAVSVAAILNKLNFNAVPVLVYREVKYIPLDTTLPHHFFNHAILKVTAKNNAVYWVDPTNVVSIAGGIFPDIADRNALVLDELNPSYEKIPNINPLSAQRITTNNIKIKNTNNIYNSGSVIFKAEQAVNIAGIGLYYSNEQIKDIAFRAVSNTNLDYSQKHSITLPDLKSRIVQDLEFAYEYEQDNALFKTNLGLAFSLKTGSWLEDIIGVAQDQVSDIIIGPPCTMINHTYISNVKIQQPENLNYDIKTPWFTFNRKLTNNKTTTEIVDTVSILQTLIPNESLNTKEYRNLKKSLEANIQNAMLILDR